MKHLVFILFISLFFLVGFGLLGWGLYSFYRGRQALRWPRTEGEVFDCRWEEDSGGEDTTYEVKVKYRYVVGGRGFEGKRVAFGYCGSGNWEEHQAILAKLQSGRRVVVHYRPDEPGDAVLAAGFNRSTFIILAFAATWLLFTTGFTVLWLTSSGADGRIVERIEVVK